MSTRFLPLLLLILAGCGSSKTAPVSGIITMNGKPLAHASVVFEPASDAKEPGPGSMGTTGADGRYSLQIGTSGASGAVVGKHTVRITAYEGDVEGESSAPSASSPVNRKALVPPEYNAQSQVTFEVPAGGTKDANFDIKITPTKPR